MVFGTKIFERQRWLWLYKPDFVVKTLFIFIFYYLFLFLYVFFSVCKILNYCLSFPTFFCISAPVPSFSNQPSGMSYPPPPGQNMAYPPPQGQFGYPQPPPPQGQFGFSQPQGQFGNQQPTPPQGQFGYTQLPPPQGQFGYPQPPPPPAYPGKGASAPPY